MSDPTQSSWLSRRRFSALGLASLLAPTGLAAQTTGDRPTLVELFTSQGCSSCPPADALMLKLAADPAFIPLTFATEIWDYLGWKDTLAKPAFTRRHKAYAAAVANRRVYTPQAIVNGRAHCVGSDMAALNRLKRASAQSATSSRFVITGVDQGWQVNLRRETAQPARVVVLPVKARQEIEIRRGENAGRMITYANVVRDLIDLGSAPETAAELRIAEAQIAAVGADAFALIVQAGGIEAPGEILGASFASRSEIRA